MLKTSAQNYGINMGNLINDIQYTNRTYRLVQHTYGQPLHSVFVIKIGSVSLPWRQPCAPSHTHTHTHIPAACLDPHIWCQNSLSPASWDGGRWGQTDTVPLHPAVIEEKKIKYQKQACPQQQITNIFEHVAWKRFNTRKGTVLSANMRYNFLLAE